MKNLITLALALSTSWAYAQNMVGYEYWFDADTAGRTYVQAGTTPLLDNTQNIDASALSVGTHHVFYRVKDSNQAWSSVQRRLFTISPEGPVNLTVLRYWSDQATNGPTDLRDLPFDQPAALIDIMENIEFCEYNSADAHHVFFQLMDDRGQWSSVIWRDVNIDAVGQAPGMATITYSPAGGIDPNTEYVFTASSTGGADYYWEFPSGWVEGAQIGNSITVTSPAITTSALVHVTPSNSCGTGTQQSLLLSPTGVFTNNRNDQVQLYPNPTTGQFTIKLEELNDRVQVMVMDMHGQQIGTVLRLDGQNQRTIDLSDASNGLYLVRIIMADRTITRTITVQR